MTLKLPKHLVDDLPYTFDYSAWPIVGDDPIASATVQSTPVGLTIGSPAINDDGDQVQVRISGGSAGVTYTLTCDATLTSGYNIGGNGQLEIT